MDHKAKLQTAGRRANAARPLDAVEDQAGPERYPPARQDDAVESGEPRRDAANPRPPQGAGDGGPPAAR